VLGDSPHGPSRSQDLSLRRLRQRLRGAAPASFLNSRRTDDLPRAILRAPLDCVGVRDAELALGRYAHRACVDSWPAGGQGRRHPRRGARHGADGRVAALHPPRRGRQQWCMRTAPGFADRLAPYCPRYSRAWPVGARQGHQSFTRHHWRRRPTALARAQSKRHGNQALAGRSPAAPSATMTRLAQTQVGAMAVRLPLCGPPSDQR